jgi:hypothetical protein
MGELRPESLAKVRQDESAAQKPFIYGFESGSAYVAGLEVYLGDDRFDARDVPAAAFERFQLAPLDVHVKSIVSASSRFDETIQGQRLDHNSMLGVLFRILDRLTPKVLRPRREIQLFGRAKSLDCRNHVEGRLPNFVGGSSLDTFHLFAG